VKTVFTADTACGPDIFLDRILQGAYNSGKPGNIC